MSLPPCDCGATNWRQLVEDTHGPNDRRRRTFKCRACGAEGRIFDGGVGATILSGAMRLREVRA